MDMKITKTVLPTLTLAASLLLVTSFNPVYAADQALDQIAAVVNKDVILMTEVQQLIRQEQRAGNQSDNKSLFQKSLNTLVLEKLQIQEAIRQGINPNEAQVNEAVTSIANRNNMDLASFRKALTQEGMTLDGFKRNIANQMRVSTLKRRQPQARNEISEQGVNDLVSSETQKISQGLSYNIQDILIPAPQPLANNHFINASQRATQLRNLALKNTAFLSTKLADSQAVDLGWKNAAELSFAYLKELNTLDVGQVSGVIQDARGFHILKLIAKRGGLNHKVYDVNVRHILVAKNENNAEMKANQLYQQLAQGVDFSTLAKIHSADKGSAINGGNLGWGNSKKYVPAFAKTTETLALNTISSPIQTNFGYHLIEVLDRKVTNDGQKQLEEKARQALASRSNGSDYDAWVDGLRSKAFIDYRIKP